jgi:hypothetical protein
MLDDEFTLIVSSIGIALALIIATPYIAAYVR